MLPKKNRLTKKTDFDKIFKEGEGLKERGLLFKVKTGEGVSRFGIVVSKKVSRKATERNRIRRILSEAIAQLKVEITKPVDIVIIVLPSFRIRKEGAAREALSQLLQKARLLK